jgi:hypothetical protein
MTAIWAVLISFVISYVLSSMAGEPFVLSDTLILAAIFAVAIFLLGDGILKEEKNNN